MPEFPGFSLLEGTIGTVHLPDHSWKHYVIRSGKAKYITQDAWFKFYDDHAPVNIPLYQEDQ